MAVMRWKGRCGSWSGTKSEPSASRPRPARRPGAAPRRSRARVSARGRRRPGGRRSSRRGRSRAGLRPLRSGRRHCRRACARDRSRAPRARGAPSAAAGSGCGRRAGERGVCRCRKDAVARQAVVERGGGEDVPGAERREPPRTDAHPFERQLDDRLRDRRVAVLGRDLGRIERLGVGELLVGVADAVPPAVRHQLGEDAALGVAHRVLRDVERRTLVEPRLPERLRRRERLVVHRLVRVHEPSVGRLVEPLGVDRLRPAARHRVAHHASGKLRTVADDQARLPFEREAVGRRVRQKTPRDEPNGCGPRRVTRVDVETHEADHGARAVFFPYARPTNDSCR